MYNITSGTTLFFILLLKKLLGSITLLYISVHFFFLVDLEYRYYIGVLLKNHHVHACL